MFIGGKIIDYDVTLFSPLFVSFLRPVYVRGRAKPCSDDLRSKVYFRRGDAFQAFFDFLVKKFFCCFSMSYEKSKK